MIILEVKERKRLSKKVRTEYILLAPGEIWWTSYKGERVTIQADQGNTKPIYVGQAK